MNDVRTVRRTPLLAVLLMTLLVSGCAGGSDDDPSTSAASSVVTVSDSDSPTGAVPPDGAAPTEDANASPDPADAPFVANTEPDTGEAVDAGSLLLSKVRFAAQDGYDRVVLEYAGTGTPGWNARYTDVASREGSGDPISVPGEAMLQVVVNGVTYPNESQTTVSSGPIAVTTTTVTGIYLDGVFEGQDQVVIGTSGKQPFRVFAVTNPPRLVIDVQS